MTKKTYLYKAFGIIAVLGLSTALLFQIHNSKILNIPTIFSYENFTVLLVLCLLYYFIFSIRLKISMTTIAKTKLTLMRGLAISLQALFYLCTIPTTAGYEAARFSKVFSACPSVSKITLSKAVLADRAAGLFSSLLLVGILLPLISFQCPASFHVNKPTLITLILIFCCVTSAIFLSNKFKKILLSIMAVFYANFSAMPALTLFSVIPQLLQTVIIAWVLHVINLPFTWQDLLFIQAISNLAGVLPISLGGIGANEGAGFSAASILGYSSTAIFAIVFSLYITKLIGAVLGGVIELKHLIIKK
jgi:hypothetical protein